MTVLKHWGAIYSNSTTSEGICIDNSLINFVHYCALYYSYDFTHGWKLKTKYDKIWERLFDGTHNQIHFSTMRV